MHFICVSYSFSIHLWWFMRRAAAAEGDGDALFGFVDTGDRHARRNWLNLCRNQQWLWGHIRSPNCRQSVAWVPSGHPSCVGWAGRCISGGYGHGLSANDRSIQSINLDDSSPFLPLYRHYFSTIRGTPTENWKVCCKKRKLHEKWKIAQDFWGSRA